MKPLSEREELLFSTGMNKVTCWHRIFQHSNWSKHSKNHTWGTQISTKFQNFGESVLNEPCVVASLTALTWGKVSDLPKVVVGSGSDIGKLLSWLSGQKDFLPWAMPVLWTRCRGEFKNFWKGECWCQFTTLSHVSQYL